MVRAYTDGGPALADGTALYDEVAIGYEHDIVDGRLEYRRDDAGELIPCVRRLPRHVTVRDHLDAAARVAATLASHGTTLEAAVGIAAGDRQTVTEDLMLQLVCAALGDDTLFEIARDITVTPEQFNQLCEDLLEQWGWADLIDDILGELPPGEG